MTDLDHLPPAAPVPAWLGQGTAVEQSRAVAEVQTAAVLAQQMPRRLDAARAMMRESCTQLFFAEKAFYSYPKGKTTVTGASIHLAKELARCWQNVDFGLIEMRRDDDNALSEMKAFAWDLQTNTRTSSTFIVPHQRDRQGGPVKLVELRDVYENNANQGARRVREQIFAILPPWFREEAVEICRATLNRGDGSSLPDRVAAAVAAYERIGVTVDQLEQKLARAQGRWSVFDLAQLMITYRSLQANELAVDEAFPPMRVTVAEIQQQAAVATPAPPQATEQPPAREGGPAPRPATQKQLTAVNTLLGTKLGLAGDERFEWLTGWADRSIASTKELTVDEAGRLIEQLGEMTDLAERAEEVDSA